MIGYFGSEAVLVKREKPFIERDATTMTDQAGYIPADVQINRFIAAGVRLQAARREEFEYPNGDVPVDVVPDPTADVGFDLADASALLNQIASSRAVEPTNERSEEVAQTATESTDSKAFEA